MQEEQQSPRKVPSEVIQLSEFQERGPLVLQARMKGRVKHALDDDKSGSLKEVQFYPKYNEIYIIGSDIEQLEGMSQLSMLSGEKSGEQASPQQKGGYPTMATEAKRQAELERVRENERRIAESAVRRRARDEAATASLQGQPTTSEKETRSMKDSSIRSLKPDSPDTLLPERTQLSQRTMPSVREKRKSDQSSSPQKSKRGGTDSPGSPYQSPYQSKRELVAPTLPTGSPYQSKREELDSSRPLGSPYHSLREPPEPPKKEKDDTRSKPPQAIPHGGKTTATIHPVKPTQYRARSKPSNDGRKADALGVRRGSRASPSRNTVDSKSDNDHGFRYSNLVPAVATPRINEKNCKIDTSDLGYYYLPAYTAYIQQPRDADKHQRDLFRKCLYKKLVYLQNWKIVVVKEGERPQQEVFTSENIHHVNASSVAELDLSSVFGLILDNESIRRNIGYLYAIKNGAKYIYEGDENFELYGQISAAFDFEKHVSGLWYYGSELPLPRQRIFHPTEFFALRTEKPKIEMRKKFTRPEGRLCLCRNRPAPAVQHAVVQAEQSTLWKDHAEINKFAPPITIGAGTYSIWQADHTLFHYKAFFVLVRPLSPKLRIRTIFSLYAQKLLNLVGLNHGFYPVDVIPGTAGYDSFDGKEGSLTWREISAIVSLFESWKCSHYHIQKCMIDLAKILKNDRYLELEHIVLVHSWIQDLKAVGKVKTLVWYVSCLPQAIVWGENAYIHPPLRF
ncbi:unnamed protein product [Nippostrongylus brasiliensis]|uniref:Doublecortin domain-containing protein n=1 Tax=Nippostrongylus brasiliensis TaxID=27835 RepID=A0A0N4XVV8_NIPBR|nr:unnamed protein product [Nippostrongylus brasiliensis]